MEYFRWFYEYTEAYFFKKDRDQELFYPWGNPGPAYAINIKTRSWFYFFLVLLCGALVCGIFYGIFFLDQLLLTFITQLNFTIFLSVVGPYLFVICSKMKSHDMKESERSSPRLLRDLRPLMLFQVLIIIAALYFLDWTVYLLINAVFSAVVFPSLYFLLRS